MIFRKKSENGEADPKKNRNYIFSGLSSLFRSHTKKIKTQNSQATGSSLHRLGILNQTFSKISLVISRICCPPSPVSSLPRIQSYQPCFPRTSGLGILKGKLISTQLTSIFRTLTTLKKPKGLLPGTRTSKAHWRTSRRLRDLTLKSQTSVLRKTSVLTGSSVILIGKWTQV